MTNLISPHRKLMHCRNLYIRTTTDTGHGVFAARAFSRGEVVISDQDGDYYQNALTYEVIIESGYSLDNFSQIDHNLYVPPNGNIDDYTNHSCDPNTGIRLTPRGYLVIALRDIARDEEITYDYSTYLNNPYERMVCRCGAANCRGVIGNFLTLPVDLQDRYKALGIVGRFAMEPSRRRLSTAPTVPAPLNLPCSV